MSSIRDSKGRWVAGVSGHPGGRPLGAKDRHRRTRHSGPQPWATANLGPYAMRRPATVDWERAADAVAFMEEVDARGAMDARDLCWATKLIVKSGL